MPFASGQALTPARLNRIQPTTYQAVASATLTLGTSLADVVGAAITLSTLGPNAVYVVEGTFDISVATAAAGILAEGHLDVDGADQTARALKSMAAVDRVTISQQWRGVLTAAGSHTLKLRGLRGASGAASIVTTHTTLQVVIYEVV